MKKEEGLDLTKLTPEDIMKLEIAEEIGVYDKIIAGGWRALSSRESGKIGGLISRRKRMEKREEA